MTNPLKVIPKSKRVSQRTDRTSRYRNAIGDWALPSLWAMKYRLLKGKPMEFFSTIDPLKRRPWMVEPLDDMSPIIVVEKARQMGFTELMLTKMVHMGTLHRVRTIYTMPKWPKAREIASTRIMPMGERKHPDRFTGEVLKRLEPGWRGVMGKAMIPRSGGGTSEVLITGSWNEDLGESTAADQIFLDEYDRMRPGVIAAFRECLSSSRLRHMRIFSTPTFPKAGVNGQYLLSDKQRWFWKCPHCGHKQFFSRANILQTSGSPSLIERLETHDETSRFKEGTFIIGCMKCQRPINRMRAKGEWVSTQQDGESRGYKVSQLDCPWHTADDIMRKLRDLKPGLQPWMNYVLGEPYLGDTGQLPENFVYQLIDPELRITSRSDFDRQFRDTRVSVGVDWGKANWAFVVGRTPEYKVPILLEPYMFRDTTNPEDTVEAMIELAKRWKAEVTVADYGYGQDRNPKLYKGSNSAVWICRYPPAGSAGATSEPIYGRNPPAASEPYPNVVIGRAPSLKERILELHAKQFSIPNNAGFEQHLDIIDMHFRNVAIVVEELADGSLVEVAESTGPDHYLHAFNYAMIGHRWLDVSQVKVRELDAPEYNMSSDPQGIISGVGLPTGTDVEDLGWLTDDYF